MTFAREEGRVGRGFRADGDVEAFIEDDLQTGALDLRYLFTLFPRRYRDRERARTRRRSGGQGTGRVGECY